MAETKHKFTFQRLVSLDRGIGIFTSGQFDPRRIECADTDPVEIKKFNDLIEVWLPVYLALQAFNKFKTEME